MDRLCTTDMIMQTRIWRKSVVAGKWKCVAATMKRKRGDLSVMCAIRRMDTAKMTSTTKAISAS